MRVHIVSAVDSTAEAEEVRCDDPSACLHDYRDHLPVEVGLPGRCQGLQVATADVRLAAVHYWDVSGTLAAGCKAAFVGWPGMVLSPIGRQPDIVGADICEVVEQILAGEAAE